MLAIGTWTTLSPDRRWMAHGSWNSADPPLEFIDIARMRNQASPMTPPELVAASAFDAAGKRFAALLESGEVWIFGLEDDGAPALLHRLTINGYVPASAARGATVGLAFAGNRTIVVTDGSSLMVGIDAASAQPQWRRSFDRNSMGATLIGAPAAPYFATSGSRVQLFHATTGTPLSDPISTTDLAHLVGAEDTSPHGMTVTDDGEVAVRFADRAAFRARPRFESVEAAIASMKSRTGTEP
jgi:hypothetical protein